MERVILHYFILRFVLTFSVEIQPLIISCPHTANNLKNAFVLVCLNRFQQIYTVHSFQAPSENVKVRSMPVLFSSHFEILSRFMAGCLGINPNISLWRLPGSSNYAILLTDGKELCKIQYSVLIVWVIRVALQLNKNLLA